MELEELVKDLLKTNKVLDLENKLCVRYLLKSRD